MQTVQAPTQFKASAWLKKANAKGTGFQTTIQTQQNIRVIAVACNYDGGDAAFETLQMHVTKSS